MKILPVLLTAALSFSAPGAKMPEQGLLNPSNIVIVEENYSLSDTYRIMKSKNAYEKLTIYSKERHKQTLQSTKEILNIPICIEVDEVNGGFLLPSEIEGIVLDIPFNYYSNLDASAKYFQILLYNGWEIEYYNATSLCIQIGLVRNGYNCRILIYEDYLKVYSKLITEF